MEKKYFTISEICEKTGLNPHILRYWEKKTGLIRPIRLSAGHRRYTLNDLENIIKIKDLIYLKGFSLKGISKIRKNLEAEGTLVSAAKENKKLKTEKAFLKSILKDLKSIEKAL
ncbi:MAG: MerR family transcriptional regulator [Elusimicrobia bacterium]|nr:MerR family transcriptional regulator [Elusimicrobiota bacterium]